MDAGCVAVLQALPTHITLFFLGTLIFQDNEKAGDGLVGVMEAEVSS